MPTLWRWGEPIVGEYARGVGVTEENPLLSLLPFTPASTLVGGVPKPSIESPEGLFGAEELSLQKISTKGSITISSKGVCALVPFAFAFEFELPVPALLLLLLGWSKAALAALLAISKSDGIFFVPDPDGFRGSILGVSLFTDEGNK